MLMPVEYTAFKLHYRMLHVSKGFMVWKIILNSLDKYCTLELAAKKYTNNDLSDDRVH